MIVLDSSGWLEFFADGPHAEEFASRLRQPANIITPTVAMYEVYKWIKRERSEEEAVEAVATMKKTHVVDLDRGTGADGRGLESRPSSGDGRFHDARCGSGT